MFSRYLLKSLRATHGKMPHIYCIKGSEARLGCMEIANTAQNYSELDSVLMTAHLMAGKQGKH